MESLNQVEKLIWKWISEDYIGKENAVTQSTLFGALGIFYPEIDPPSTYPELRHIMRELRQKRPILTSLKNPPGYYKPAIWEEVKGCLARRKYTALRMLSLNKKMLEVCKELFPEQTNEQLNLFENKSVSEFIEEISI